MFEGKIKVRSNSILHDAIVKVAGEEISVEVDNLKITKSGPFPFIVLAEIRKDFERDGLFLMINASRIDIYPSGMTLPGFKAYMLEIGKPAYSKDLVNIFDETDRPDLISTVEQQKKYHEEWIESLRSKK